MKIDFLAIGDITTDAFIRIKDATVNCDVDTEHCKLCFNFGDKIPFESVEIVKAVGNSSNASVSASRLGLKSSLLAYIGDDQNGQECKESLEKDGVDTSYIRVEKGKNTNYHYVLWYDVERTILVNHTEFSYSLGEIEPPKWIYLSSLGENSLPYQLEIANFIEKNPEIKLAFQPGTFQIKLGKDTLAKIYKNSYIFFCNVQEAQTILGTKTADIKELLSGIHDLGPKIVCITDGIKGAYAYDGNENLFIPIYPQEPFERTGAGDSFSSTVVSALALGKSLEEALMWGPINSMSVVQHVGAQKGLLTQEKLLEYLKNAPDEYKISRI